MIMPQKSGICGNLPQPYVLTKCNEWQACKMPFVFAWKWIGEAEIV